MSNMGKIGMAELNVCLPPDAITTLGLGSCVGVVLYDPGKKVCGMVHVMLPDSTKIKNNENIAKFADTGIEELLRRVLELGAVRRNLVAKLDACQVELKKLKTLLQEQQEDSLER